jgi:hypothetical protein
MKISFHFYYKVCMIFMKIFFEWYLHAMYLYYKCFLLRKRIIWKNGNETFTNLFNIQQKVTNSIVEQLERKVILFCSPTFTIAFCKNGSHKNYCKHHRKIFEGTTLVNTVHTPGSIAKQQLYEVTTDDFSNMHMYWLHIYEGKCAWEIKY